MRRSGTLTALLSALIGLVLVLTGAGAAAWAEPGPAVSASQASVPAERSETEKEMPAGVTTRHASHANARPGPGPRTGLRPTGPCHASAEPALRPCTPRTGPGGPPPYPSRRTGGATASVFQVFRC